MPPHPTDLPDIPDDLALSMSQLGDHQLDLKLLCRILLSGIQIFALLLICIALFVSCTIFLLRERVGLELVTERVAYVGKNIAILGQITVW